MRFDVNKITQASLYNDDGLLKPGLYLLQHKEDELPGFVCAVSGRGRHREQIIALIDNLSPEGQSQDVSEYLVVGLLYDFVPH